MKKFREFNTTYKLIIGTVSSILSALLIDYLMEKFDDKTVSIAFMLSVIVVLILLINSIVERAVERSHTIRKAIAGDEHIEGYWYDFSVEQDTNQVKHGVLFSIKYEGGKYALYGVTYDGSGHRIATFRSKNSVYQDRVLFCEYESHTEYMQSSLEQGVLQIQFDLPPTSYTGFYFDYSGAMNFKIQGERVPDDVVKQHNRFKYNEDKKAFLVGQIQKKQKELDDFSQTRLPEHDDEA